MGMLDIYINGILPIMGTVCIIIHFGKAHEFKQFKTSELIGFVLFSSIAWPITLIILLRILFKKQR